MLQQLQPLPENNSGSNYYRDNSKYQYSINCHDHNYVDDRYRGNSNYHVHNKDARANHNESRINQIYHDFHTGYNSRYHHNSYHHEYQT